MSSGKKCIKVKVKPRVAIFPKTKTESYSVSKITLETKCGTPFVRECVCPTLLDAPTGVPGKLEAHSGLSGQTGRPYSP